MVTRTLLIAKPDCVSAGNVGAVLSMVEKKGFKILAQRMLRMSANTASRFYIEHKDRPFYKDLVQYMSSGPVVVFVLSKDNAVRDMRSLLGHTDPAKAEDGTIRKLFGKSIDANAAHASDSDGSAVNEIKFFFADAEIDSE